MMRKAMVRTLGLLLGAMIFLCPSSVGATQVEEIMTEDDNELTAQQAVGDNAYPAKAKGEYSIRAVYKGGTKDGQYDQYTIAISKIDTTCNINTSRTVQAVATYNGNAANSLITEMSHTATSPNVALYSDLGKNTFSLNKCYIYSTFKLNVPTGYKISEVSYSGQGNRGTLYHLYLDNANLQFHTTTKTWNSSTANLLSETSSDGKAAQRIAVRSMVDIFYHAGVGTTSVLHADDSGKVLQKIVVSPIQYTLYAANLSNVTEGWEASVSYDTPFTLPMQTPTKEGYQFAGWQIGGNTYSSGQVLSTTQVNALCSVQSARVCANAVWTPVSYSISYDTNGAESTVADQTVNYESNVVLPAEVTRKGYSFGGWLHTASGKTYSALQTIPASLLSSKQDDHVVFQAIWMPNHYNIAYYMSELEEHPFQTVTHVVDQMAPLLSEPQKTGYDFTGWSLDGAMYSASQTVVNLTVEKDRTLQAFAKWQPIRYNITFHGNGATQGSTTNQDKLAYDVSYRLQPNGYKKQYDITYDLQGGTLDNPVTRVSSVFQGWTLTPAYDENLFLDNASFINLTTKAETITLYAQWDDAPLTVTLPVAQRKPTTVPAKNEQGEDGYRITNYNFVGWKEKSVDLNAEEKSVLDAVIKVTKNMDLEAVWKEEVSFSKEAPRQDTSGQILNKLDELNQKFSNEYNLTHEQAKSILEAIENGSAFTLKMGSEEYTIVRNEDGTLTIKLASLSPDVKVVTIPSEVKIGGSVFPITEIYKECFKDRKGLEKVIVGNHIVKIGDAAFSGCTSLKEAVLSEGLVAIGSRAFSGCTGMTKLECPASLQTIGDYAFMSCKNLKKLKLSNGLLTIGNYSFFKCSSLVKIRIPDTVLRMGKYAFAKCSKCKSVTTSKACTKMGEGVFCGCKSLEKVILKDALTEIPEKAFWQCNKLRNVTVPKKIIAIRERAFFQCKNLKQVTIKTTFLGKVGRDAFGKCHKNICFTVPQKKKDAYAKLLRG